MRYEGPIYRPPSEADSLLIQATVGCPHNRCTFCMIYKNGPRYRVRPVSEIKEDISAARDTYGSHASTLFFPAGNTIAMRTDDLVAICGFARKVFPDLERITVYGSSQYLFKKGPQGLKRLAEAVLSRIQMIRNCLLNLQKLKHRNQEDVNLFSVLDPGLIFTG